jgi:hypothetical protein
MKKIGWVSKDEKELKKFKASEGFSVPVTAVPISEPIKKKNQSSAQSIPTITTTTVQNDASSKFNLF